MSALSPCPRCNRHVRDATCPFCNAAVARREPIPTLGKMSRAMVFASATLAATTGCAHPQKQPPQSPPKKEMPEREYQNHPCGVNQYRVDEAQKKLDEAKTDDEKQAAQQELEEARVPVCAPYGAPPARRRVV